MKEKPKTKLAKASGKTVNQSAVTLSQVFMPEHAGPGGVFIHGGEIIKLMDTAAGLAALRHSKSQVVTLRVEGINFHHPIRVGNYVTTQAKLTFASTSAMEIQVTVMAEDVLREKSWMALTAFFIFVALNKDGKTTNVPPLIVSTEEEQRLFKDGELRFNTCRIDEMSKTLCALV